MGTVVCTNGTNGNTCCWGTNVWDLDNLVLGNNGHCLWEQLGQLLGNRWTVLGGNNGTHVTGEQMANVCVTNGTISLWEQLGQLLGNRWTVFVGNNGTHVTGEQMANVCVTNGTIRNTSYYRTNGQC